MKLQMCCVSSDGLSVLGHWFCVSVQTGCALQLWHHNNMHQTLQRSFLNISDLMCNKTMRVPHIRGKLWENLRRTEGCNLLQSLQILIPDLAWVSSDARCRRSFHLNIQLTQVKLNRSSSPPSDGKDQIVSQRTGEILLLQTKPDSLESSEHFYQLPKGYYQGLSPGWRIQPRHSHNTENRWLTRRLIFYPTANKAGLRLKSPIF